ncbi:hypothetical protein DPMN_000421 [Dreissena polymorpha]|uniref:Uncharacterized protein n=1 Tax=Dreissena polymorpha TaxID=45954 RepID=A0A9D4MFT1_DREPO|nr:hypothetical protein DPMN_000421 [Dreissena polymorpha]
MLFVCLVDVRLDLRAPVFNRSGFVLARLEHARSQRVGQVELVASSEFKKAQPYVVGISSVLVYV